MTVRTDHNGIYVGGDWVKSRSQHRVEVVDPTTEGVIGMVPGGDPEDVAVAVDAAAAALPAWAARPATERAEFLRRIAAGMQDRAEQLLTTVVSEVGTPRTQAAVTQVQIAIDAFADAAEHVESMAFEERIGAGSSVVREPVGVVACVTPWNYPLYLIALKVAPALAVGCTVVLKPSEVAGLNAYLLADVIHDAGLPPGVFNMVSGTGQAVGEPLCAHPGVDMVSFTGSNATGRRIATVAAETVKRLALELGGKSANVILADSDIERAVAHGLANCLANAGQTCGALTRMIVPRHRLSVVEDVILAHVGAYEPGDPMDPDTRLGPLVSAVQRDRVLSFIRAGIDEGARPIAGAAVDDVPSRGYYVNATVFSDVDPHSTIAQEEIFGPVLSIIAVDSEEEAIAVANGTRYGLVASVWSGDVEHAREVGSRLRAGSVYLNGGTFDPAAPAGGVKQSGYGRERGRFGLEEFVQTKSFIT